MKRLYLLMILFVAGLVFEECHAASLGDADVEDRVNDLLGNMTLEEKVGQMNQITLEVVAEKGEGEHLALDLGKLRNALLAYHVGSILNCGGQARTIENWHEIITAIQDIATKETRLGIPVLYGIDAIHGANYTVGATLFPQNIAMAAAGNVELVRRSAEITAHEIRASGIPWNFNPVLGLARQPLWSRCYETYGEDPYLVSVMGAAYIRGLQGDDISDPTRAASCMKHYIGYSVPKSGRDRTPAWIPDRMLRQLFLPPFAAAVEAGTVTVMVNSSEINGVPVHSSKYFLKEILRHELGFKGFVVSDWNDINNLYEREMVAENQREAVKIAVLAGIDMSMVPYDFSFFDHLVDLVRDGEVPESRIDEAVANILRVKFALGQFENPYPDKTLIDGFSTEASRAVNVQAAGEAITLLENGKGLLPLDKDTKVLVTGPTAHKLSYMNGGWTITWQGDREDLYPDDNKTILEAIRDEIGEEQVVYVEGSGFDEEGDIQAAVDAAGDADVVIACLGEPTYCETPGNIDDLTLPWAQSELISELKKASKPIVLVLVEGRPRIIREIVPLVDAVVMGYLPGMEGGPVLADMLFGDINPSGKLPFSYPRFAGGYSCYDHKASEEFKTVKFNPQWAFGHGLSYATFAYENLSLDRKVLNDGDELGISVDIQNSGDRPGKEIVQLYLSDLVASVTPAVKNLRRFTKVDLGPGESTTVEFRLNWEDFSFIGRDYQRIVEPGKFKIAVGPLTEEFEIELEDMERSVIR